MTLFFCHFTVTIDKVNLLSNFTLKRKIIVKLITADLFLTCLVSLMRPLNCDGVGVVYRFFIGSGFHLQVTPVNITTSTSQAILD